MTSNNEEDLINNFTEFNIKITDEKKRKKIIY